MTAPEQIPNDAPLSVTLKAAAWGEVLRVLADAPYRVVAPLINDIQQQCVEAAQQLPQPKANGAAEHLHG